MARPPVYPTAAVALDTLISEHIAPELKAIGFRKKRRTFSSRAGSLIRVIHFDGFWCSTAESLMFAVDLAVWSDKVAAFRPYAEFGWNLPVKPKSASWVPPAHHGHWRERLDKLVPDLWKGQFTIDRGTFRPRLVKAIRSGVLDHAAELLLSFESEEQLLKHIRSGSSEGTPPLALAALYSIAAPKDFSAVAEKLIRLARETPDPEVERVWTLSLKRMGYKENRSRQM